MLACVFLIELWISSPKSKGCVSCHLSFTWICYVYVNKEYLYLTKNLKIEIRDISWIKVVTEDLFNHNLNQYSCDICIYNSKVCGTDTLGCRLNARTVVLHWTSHLNCSKLFVSAIFVYPIFVGLVICEYPCEIIWNGYTHRWEAMLM